MASSEELFESRIGREAGLHGTPPCTTTHRVTCDSTGQDPIRVLCTAGYTGAVPIGTQHPHNSTLTAQDYRIFRRINTLNWEVDVLYRLPLIVLKIQPVQNGWWIDLQSSIISGPMIMDIPDSEIQGAKPKIIGYDHMRVATADEAEGPGPFFYAMVDGANTTTLVRTGKRVSEPYDSGHPVIGFSLTKRFVELNFPGSVGPAANFLNTVNGVPFDYLTDEINTVRFDAVTIRTERGQMEDDVNPSGVIFVVRLDFTYNRDRWSPIKKYAQWTDEEGSTALVKDDQGDFVTDESHVLYSADLNAMVGNFG